MGKDEKQIDSGRVWKIIYDLASQRRDEAENKHTEPAKRASGEALAAMRQLIEAGVPVEIPAQVTATYEPKPVKQVAKGVVPVEPAEPEKVEGALGKIGSAVASGLKKVLGIGGDKEEAKESATQ